jgi:hypothetical protein
MTMFLRRPSLQPSGMAVGGGDTGFQTQPQPHLFTVTLTADKSTVTKPLPSNTKILGFYVEPVFGRAPAGGTVDIVNASDENSAILEPDLDEEDAPIDTPASALKRKALSAPIILAEASEVEFSAAGLEDDEAVILGLEVILPRIRA